MYSKIYNVKISFSKINNYLKLIQRQSYFKALKVLLTFPTKISAIIWNSLSSALNNLTFSNFKQAKSMLTVENCYSTKGKTFKRFQARAKGKKFQIKKKTCKIFFHLSFKSKL